MALPKDPRQQMITMMYLVLTALLALNVSAEILKAFTIVNKSLEKTGEVIEGKSKLMYDQFEAKMNDPNTSAKTAPFNEKAQKVKAECAALSKWIAETKDHIIDLGGNHNGERDDGDFQNVNTGQLEGEKNLDISSMVFVNQGRGKEFRDKVIQTRQALLALVDNADDKALYTNTLPLAEPVDPEPAPGEPQKSWEDGLFGEIPLAASVTLLSKFEADVKTTEAELVNYLLGQISAADFKFDKLKAMVVAPSSYVMQGSEYKSEIFVSAFSSTSNPEVILGAIDSSGTVSGDTTHIAVKQGIGTYTIRPSAVGEQTYKGVIKIAKPDGSGFEYYPFASSYVVVQPMAVVSPTKMNVLYIGVDNPLAISAAGVTADKVNATISGGTLKPGKRKGEYFARVSKPGDAVVNVSAKMDDGSSKQLGKQDFRVKRVPDPIAEVAKMSGGNVKSGTFKAQRGIMAVLENFDFEFKYTIQSFEVTYAAKRQDLVMGTCNGPVFDSKVQGWVSRAKPGDMFYFDNIKAKGEDGTSRKLKPIAFKII